MAEFGKKRKFGYYSNAMQVVEGMDFKGKVAVITGANTGIGFEATRALAHHGCKVIMACREMERANSALKKLKDEKVR